MKNVRLRINVRSEYIIRHGPIAQIVDMYKSAIYRVVIRLRSHAGM